MKIIKKITKVQINKVCRFCNSTSLNKLFDFGNVPLAGGFLKPKNKIIENYYPLSIKICKNCLLLQVAEVVSPKILFSNYLYSSGAIKSYLNHFSFLSKEIMKLKPKKILEIGSNDGSFLENFNWTNIETLGVDPSRNLSRTARQKNLNIVNDFFSEKLAKKIYKKSGKFDIIVSINSFAHIDNIQSVIKGIDLLLDTDGILIIEIGYAKQMILGGIFDTIYHEHVNYYTLYSLQKFFISFGFEIYDSKEIDMFGGSVRVFIKRKENRKQKVTNNFKELYSKEKKLGLHTLQKYLEYGEKIKAKKTELTKVVNYLIKNKIYFCVYGASGKSTMQTVLGKLKTPFLKYVLDDSAVKHGLLNPFNHVQIVSSDILLSNNPPKFCLIFAWAYSDNIIKGFGKYIKNGGTFITFLPELVIKSNNQSDKSGIW